MYQYPFSTITLYTTILLYDYKVANSRFGGRATTEQCAVAVIVMSLQSIVGVVIQVDIKRILNVFEVDPVKFKQSYVHLMVLYSRRRKYKK